MPSVAGSGAGGLSPGNVGVGGGEATGGAMVAMRGALAGGGTIGSPSGGALGQSGASGAAAGGGAGSGVAGSAGFGGSGGTTAIGGSAGAGAAAGGAPSAGAAGALAGSGGKAGSGAGGTGGASSCNVPANVSFKQHVQPFLIKACGGGNGCHVIDAAPTTSAGGYNHAYDWITGGSHKSSCPTWPMRFEIVVDVIKAPNPPTCSKSRQMPPPDATGAGKRTPLTACEIETLQAWLKLPLVTQTHRADDSSPTTAYPMPPFN